jgi:hypothetical protein
MIKVTPRASANCRPRLERSENLGWLRNNYQITLKESGAAGAQHLRCSVLSGVINPGFRGAPNLGLQFANALGVNDHVIAIFRRAAFSDYLVHNFSESCEECLPLRLSKLSEKV